MPDSKSFDELIPVIRQKRLQTPENLSGIVRTLVRFHDPLSRWLIRTRVSAIQLTVAWFVVSLVSFGVTAIGSPWGFVAGALLLYAAIIIDLCDGEIGRFRAQSMTPEEDLVTYIHGVYLDRVFHFISSQLWPLAIALGLYRMHGQVWAFVAAVPVLLSINIHRLRPYLNAYLFKRFARAVRDLQEAGGFDKWRERQYVNRWLIVRVFWYLSTLIRNGKRTNFVLLVAGLIDCAWLVAGMPAYCQAVHGSFLLMGVLAFVIESCTIFGNVYVGTVVAEVVAATAKQDRA
ncbi:MAG: hypothetical protein KDA42_17450 [Planctomycetales bacterium]|nr:hypothetical protein [Planctomycetales bacterium]